MSFIPKTPFRSIFTAFLSVALLVATQIAAAFPPGQATGFERLILIGGGSRPPGAMAQFVQWSKEYILKFKPPGSPVKTLVITWASGIPDREVAANISRDIRLQGHAQIELSLRPPKNRRQVEKLLAQIDRCSGVFFSGGDQNKVMAVLKEYPDLYEKFLRKYREGLPIAGTSAGTAMQSRVMIQGEPPEKPGKEIIHPRVSPEGVPPTTDGLGFLPDDVIVDQHFLEKGRWNRLVPLISDRPKTIGIGVQEGGAISIEGGREVRILNDQPLFFVDSVSLKGGQPRFYILERGDALDLHTRVFRKINPSSPCIPALMLNLMRATK